MRGEDEITAGQLLDEITALRADIQALPDRIVNAASKKIDEEVMRAWWFLVVAGLAYGLWHDQWVPVARGVGCIALYLLSKRVFRKWEK